MKVCVPHVQKVCTVRRLAYSHRTLISCQWVFSVGNNTRATIAVWHTSSYSGCRQGEHSYHASSGCGLERTKTEDAFVIEGEEQTLYILEADIGERKGTVTINRQKSRLLEKRPMPRSHQTRFALACGAFHTQKASDRKLRRQQCHY
jgi:hypothetical protein